MMHQALTTKCACQQYLNYIMVIKPTPKISKPNTRVLRLSYVYWLNINNS